MTESRTVETTLSSSDYERVEKAAARAGLSVPQYTKRALADETRFAEVAHRGGEVIIKEPNGRLERVKYRRCSGRLRHSRSESSGDALTASPPLVRPFLREP